MKKVSILVVFLLMLLLTCVEDSGDFRIFYAADFSGASQTFYKIDARLLAENDICYVWAEKKSGVTEATAQKVADSYKNDVYNKMLNAFGYKIKFKDKNGKDFELNNVQYVNWIAKGDNYDGKLTILLLDIKDNYRNGYNDSFIAGYFWAGDLLNYRNSNKCDILYVDTKPGIPGSINSNETLSHEMQHLMNFAGAVRRGKPTELWIDEGLSVTAEKVYLEGHSLQRLYSYNHDVSGLLGLGNNFYVWGNREGEGKSKYAVLDDYSTVYLFFQWLGLHSDMDIYRKISASDSNDYNAVINAFNDTVSGTQYADWESLLKDWLAANYFRNSVGRYGYADDTMLNDIKIRYAPDGPAVIDLFPGEGVYSGVIELTSIPSPSGNINYAGLTGSSLVSSGTISSGALLTFNANTNNNDDKSRAESGIITGKVPSAPPMADITQGSRGSGTAIGPFPISGSDKLRQNGFNFDGMDFKIPDAYRGIIVYE